MIDALSIKSQLSQQQLMLLESEMASKRKSVALAYVLDIFLGTTGAHRFYLGSTAIAVTQLVLFVVGLATFAIFVGIFFIGVSGLIAVIDLFLIPGLAQAADAKVEREVLNRMALMGSIGAASPTPPAIAP